MPFDINNQFTGTFYGKDRLGVTTPDPTASDTLRPWLTIPYPAPWLPQKRRDEGHPVGASVVLSSGHLVGLDKSGALIPAGLFSGTQAAKASGGKYCLIQYSQDDIGFTMNAKTGVPVAAAGEYVVLAAPSDGAAGDVVDGITLSSGDVTFAKACNLIPGGTARAIGFVPSNVFQYLGGATVTSTTGGVSYTMDPNNPTGYRILNYMHQPGCAVQTELVLRLPWIGALPTTLATLASTDGIVGYTQTNFSLSFVHFTGAAGNSTGNLFPGCCVVPSTLDGIDAGNYMPYDPTIHTFDQVVGRVLGIENLVKPRDYQDRVRTQFDRAQSFVGPFADKNPSTFLMGGSANRGQDTQISLATNGIFRKAIDQGKTVHPEYSTYVYVLVNTKI